MIGPLARGGAKLRQWRADLLARFWLRPAVMTLAAVLLAQLLVWSEGWFDLPAPLSGWVYAGGREGARGVLAAIAGAAIGVAGTTFSITVAALTLASSQMGPRLLRNFTRDAGNQYALGAFLATFAYALTVLRTVRGLEDEGSFVPQLAVTVGLLLGLACVGVLTWFLHHVASSINVTQVVALVQRELTQAIHALPDRSGAALPRGFAARDMAGAAALTAPATGYLRVLDDAALAEWAAGAGARIRLRVRPGDYLFPHSAIGEVAPATQQDAAQQALARAMTLGASRSVEQDLEYAVRQLVEVALRALSPSLNDPFTAIAVLDGFGAALCDLAAHEMPDGCTPRDGALRLQRPNTDYAGLLDAMFHLIRQSGAGEAAVMIRLLEVLAEVVAVERDPARREELRRHGRLVERAARHIQDRDARAALRARAESLRMALEGG